MREHKVKLLALLAIVLCIFGGFRLLRSGSTYVATVTSRDQMDRTNATVEHDIQASPLVEPAPMASTSSASTGAVLVDFTLSPGKAGPISSGMTIEELYSAVGRDHAKLVSKESEGIPYPVMEIYTTQAKDSEPSLEAEIEGNPSKLLVDGITVHDPRFKTEKGIGVGSTLGEIRQSYNVDWIDFGEGPLFARVDEIGMSFALDFNQPSDEWRQTHDQRLIPDSAKTASILVVQ